MCEEAQWWGAYPPPAAACLPPLLATGAQAAHSSLPFPLDVQAAMAGRALPQQQRHGRRSQAQQQQRQRRSAVVAVAAGAAAEVSISEERLDGCGMRLHITVPAELCKKAYKKVTWGVRRACGTATVCPACILGCACLDAEKRSISAYWVGAAYTTVPCCLSCAAGDG